MQGERGRQVPDPELMHVPLSGPCRRTPPCSAKYSTPPRRAAGAQIPSESAAAAAAAVLGLSEAARHAAPHVGVHFALVVPCRHNAAPPRPTLALPAPAATRPRA